MVRSSHANPSVVSTSNKSPAARVAVPLLTMRRSDSSVSPKQRPVIVDIVITRMGPSCQNERLSKEKAKQRVRHLLLLFSFKLLGEEEIMTTSLVMKKKKRVGNNVMGRAPYISPEATKSPQDHITSLVWTYFFKCTSFWYWGKNSAPYKVSYFFYSRSTKNSQNNKESVINLE